MNFFSSIKMIVLLSFRNITANKVKSLIVSIILTFGTFLLIMGTSLLDSIERSMSSSIIKSLAAHLQVYSSDAKDKLALFGGNFMGSEDLGKIADLEKSIAAVKEHPNIQAVIPMGMHNGLIINGNDVDIVLENLRKAIEKNDSDASLSLIAKAREIIKQIKEDHQIQSEIVSDKEKMEKEKLDLEKALSEEFWSNFSLDVENNLQFLETHIAPLSQDGKMIYIRFVGTDLDSFKNHFDRFSIVKGQMVPEKQRGFLFNNHFYEKWIKNKVARDFDTVYQEVIEKDNPISKNPQLATQIAQMSRQYKRITYQLHPSDAQKIETALRKYLPKFEGSFVELLQNFLRVNDNNIKERYKMFYDLIAPHIRLYDFNVGDTVTLRSYTESGYMKAVNIKFFGTFAFEGLDKSSVAGSYQLTDMLTFRELFGLLSKKQEEELKNIKSSAGLKEVDHANAENELFGDSGSVIEQQASESNINEELSLLKHRELSEQKILTFTQNDIDHGIAINLAVFLKNFEILNQTQSELTQMFKEKNIPLQVTDWNSASGMVGQFITLIRMVLYIAIFVIFLVALIIINNSMVMSTIERTKEIGTMRAIGAHRSFVLTLFLVETIILGIISGTIGSALGSAVVLFFGQTGIPAVNDITVFLFSGPKLYPNVYIHNYMFSFFVILAVSVISTFYPAFIAAKVQPIIAMQGKE